MILVFDTNVFLQVQRNLWELMDYFPSSNSTPEFLIAIDDQLVMLQEYLAYAETADPDSPIRVLTDKIMDGSGWFVLEKSAQKARRLLFEILHQQGCGDPIQPELFGVTASCADGVLVCPNHPEALRIPRNYLKTKILHSISQDCHENDIKVQVRSLRETLKLLRQPREFAPSTISQLKDFLDGFRFGEKESEERRFLEFKCPRTDHLTTELLYGAVEAVCAMLNSTEGWVLIGVEPHRGMIVPFPPRYISAASKEEAKLQGRQVSKVADVDQLLQDIYAEVERIYPSPGRLVNIWPILDEERKNCVIMIRVHQGSHDYLYRNRDRDWKKRKLGREKYIRGVTNTMVDPTWKR